MYLHIGNDFIVNSRNVVGIFDIENSSTSAITRDYLAAAEKNRRVIYCTYELPKSFVVCFDENTLEERVYISQLSCATLLKRSKKAAFKEFSL
ncbi:extracellular matrix regulator RemB [Ruminococcus sp.]|uniref:extracellular matrix regulator RemB n=1 Tax=Ruminococcus sp. TaxID=41978 RepID=UPI0025D34CA9|nr:extracellular matrix/biofilm biosynthesis regulator RemA family protein [Ruminococcus sp.]MBQ8967363.1 DUF370 domain-containing protein [Ruminococcus sp.]